MIIQRTVKLTLNIDPKVLLPTVNLCTKAYNFACKTAFSLKKIDSNHIHQLTYSEMRDYLPSQLSVSTRCKSVETIKSVRTLQKKEYKKAIVENREPKIYRCPESKQAGVRYDHRSYNIWFDRNQVSLLTVHGRIKCSFSVPEYFYQYLSWKRRSATLVIKNNKVFLHVSFQKDISTPEGTTKRIVGIDRGINNPAVLSTNKFYGGKHVQIVKKRYQRLRSILQSKGHSGKRHFVKLRDRENRFVTDANHCISKNIVSSLKKGDTIVFEDLTDIRQSKTKEKEKNPRLRKKTNSWSFYQLEALLAYKAIQKGIVISFVSPCYTSQECSKCGHISENNRVTQSLFICEKCGFTIHADLNASRVIRQRFLEARFPNKACRQQAKRYVVGGSINSPDAPHSVLASKLRS